MRLLELVGVKSFYDKDLDDVIKSLEEKGHELLGRGSFGIAVKGASKPGVIKFWIEDSSYDDFVEYIQSNPSKFFPKLLSKPKKLTTFFARPEEFPDKIKYVRMEELSRLPHSLIADDIELMTQNMLFRVNPYAPEEMYDRLDSVARRKDTKLTNYMTKEEFLEFYEVMKKMINALVGKHKNGLDIHDENVMMRGRQVVVSDPIYNESDLSVARDIRRYLEKMKSNDPYIKRKTGPTKGSNK